MTHLFFYKSANLSNDKFGLCIISKNMNKIQFPQSCAYCKYFRSHTEPHSENLNKGFDAALIVKLKNTHIRTVIKRRTYGPNQANLRQVKQHFHLRQIRCPAYKLPMKLASIIGSAKNSVGLAKLASLSNLLSGKCLCTIDISESYVSL